MNERLNTFRARAWVARRCSALRRSVSRGACAEKNRQMDPADKTVRYRIAREVLKDNSTKVLYCTEAVGGTDYAVTPSRCSVHKSEDVTPVIIDEVHGRAVQSDYALALTLAAVQAISRTRLVLMSATGDQELVEKRNPFCQWVALTGACIEVSESSRNSQLCIQTSCSLTLRKLSLLDTIIELDFH